MSALKNANNNNKNKSFVFFFYAFIFGIGCPTASVFFFFTKKKIPKRAKKIPANSKTRGGKNKYKKYIE